MNSGYQVSLGDFAEIVMGQAPPGPDCNKEGRGIVFVKAGEFTERRPLVREWTTKPLKLARSGDVLVCVVGATAGKINEAMDCAIGRSVAAVRPESSRIFSGYLYHFLATQVLSLRAKSQGLAQGVITREMLQQLPIPLPAIAEQRRIAAILDKADELRIKRRVAISQVNNLIVSIFFNLFGDPANNPKRWKMTAFGSEISSVRYGTGSPPQYSEEGHPFIRATNVKGGTIIVKDLKRISNAEASKIEKCKVKHGDLIIVRSGANTGDSALVPETYDGAYAAFDLVVELPFASAVFYNFLINSSFGKKVLAPLTRRAGQPHLNAEQLRSLQFISPSIELREKFAELVSEGDKIRAVQHASLVQMNALFASLQHRAFRGEL